MIAASVSFAVMGAFVKLLHGLPVWEVTFFRGLVNFLVTLPWVIANYRLIRRVKDEPVALLVRGISGCASIVLYFYAIEHIRLADAVMLNQSSPILVLIFSAIFLNERLSAPAVLCVLVAFLGIGLIVKPVFSVTSDTQKIATLAGLASTLVAAIAYISIKVATRSIPTRLIVATFALITTLATLLPTLIFFVRPDAQQWLWLLAAGVFATLGQEFMTLGYSKLPITVASPMLLLNVVFSTLVGWMVWGELPDRWSVLGMLLIAAGLTGAFRFRRL